MILRASYAGISFEAAMTRDQAERLARLMEQAKPNATCRAC
jgi:hypothetical protein